MLRSTLTLFAALALATPALADDETIVLFNGKDMSGWKAVLQDENTKMEDVWSVKDGIMHCKGRPVGYIRTERDDFKNYELTVEWRWPEDVQGGNNGVLVHTTEPGALGIWPRSIEVQLADRNAGDFWVIGTTLEVPNPEGRVEGRRHKNLTDDSEKPHGQWNTMVIRCEGDTIVVHVNGDKVNEAFNCSATQGAISLQSEGAPIEFRKVELRPLSSGR
jgi:hypothetical protein